MLLILLIGTMLLGWITPLGQLPDKLTREDHARRSLYQAERQKSHFRCTIGAPAA